MISKIQHLAACSSSSKSQTKIRDIVDVFCRYDSGAIWQMHYENGEWSSIEHGDPFGGSGFAGAIQAASLVPDHVDLFGLDAGGAVLHYGKTGAKWESERIAWVGQGDVAPVWWYSGMGGNLRNDVFRANGASLAQYIKGVGGVSGEKWQGPWNLGNYFAGPLTAFNLSDLHSTPFAIVGLDVVGKLVILQYYGDWQWRREYDYQFTPGERLVSCVLASDVDQYTHINIFELAGAGQIRHHFSARKGWTLQSYLFTSPAQSRNDNWTLMACCDRSPTEVDLFLSNDANQVMRIALAFPLGLEPSTSPPGSNVQVSSEIIYSGVIDKLETFSHVVVLMLENRSFDNILGYLYPEGVPATAPLGKTFEGINAAERRLGHALFNPVNTDAVHQPPPQTGGKVEVVPVEKNSSAVGGYNYFQPYPDPGEEYPHVNTQLFNTINTDENLPNPVPTNASMDGFVNDYIENYKTNMYKGQDPTYDEYRQIMQCYPTEAVSVLSTLATEFAVFDHWYCSVPSQTWCNRAFWHAGTSWGKVINGPSVSWETASAGPTIFNQIHASGEDSPLDWRVYSDQPFVALTGIIHNMALKAFHVAPYDKFPRLTPNFFIDCAAGELPAYSFLEPRFWAPHNDMHPSTPGSAVYDKGPVGSVLLGEALVRQVYEAIRTSNSQKPGANNSQNTLLIITFDEHGGCYDHVSPPSGAVAPDASQGEDGFDFKRLGVRVPMIMVSAHIARNTVVNTPMDHCAFMKTVGKKWNAMLPNKFPPLTARVANAPEFTEVFTAAAARPASDWPVIAAPNIPPDAMKQDFSDAPLGDLGRSIFEAILVSPQAMQARTRGVPISDPDTVATVGEAEAILKSIPGLRN